MKKILAFLYLLTSLSCGDTTDNTENVDFTTVFEKSHGTETATYEEVIAFYEALDKAYPSIKTYSVGTTDIGEPLTLITFNPDRSFESEFSNNSNATRLLINNGIHPGEPDGIDATMLLMRDLAQGTIETPENVWIGAIAIYNIGGALNRNSESRTNQEGPKAYGFRGNAQNYDLNRDFIKNDTKNAQAFTEIYHLVQPDLFIDNHVSNGADYQYVLTHLLTQHNKLGGPLGEYLNATFQPKLEAHLEEKDWPITPYVNVFNTVPENGFSQFMDHPRYSTGYTSLWNTLGLMVETHMLKPYKSRVEGTYELMKSVIEIAETDGAQIQELRKQNDSAFAKATTYPVSFAIDSAQASKRSFLGYEGTMMPSEITGKQRLKYNRNAPFTKEISYYNTMQPTRTVSIPKYYYIPRGWRKIALKLRENKIKLTQLKKDTTFVAEVYYIEDYNTRRTPYEGHYLHYNTQIRTVEETVTIPKDGYRVPTDQDGIRYLLETLEPEMVDSFFNWNFFDTILQQKEGFSPYVWEDKAKELLENDPDLNAAFKKKKQEDSEFAQNWYAQLDWLHKKSPHYEKAHLRYPIVRVSR